MSETATSTEQSEAPRVLVRRDGRLGRLTLNRVRAINALDLGMVQALAAALDDWDRGGDVDVVLLDGAGERGLCAGGDVRGLYDQIVAGDAAGTGMFFRAEYALNTRIAEYPQPIVVLADGITMGGGIGLASHASLRVVTERSKLAMPETRIGFTPDVGGTWLLGRAPGRTGEYLALTGASMDAADALHAGFADVLVPSERLDDVRAALASYGAGEGTGSVEDRVRAFSAAPGLSRLEASRAWIDDAFSAGSVEGIVERLRARPEAEASATADLLAELSPTALAATLAAVRAARTLPDLRAALAQEYALVLWFATTQPDLVEGIRAQLVDKDRRPRWRPAAISDVDPGTGAAALAFRPDVPLWPETARGDAPA